MLGNYTVDVEFRDFLLACDCRMTRIFLCCERVGDVDFVGLSDKSGMVSYLPANRVDKVLRSGIDPFSEEAGRATMSVGRLPSRMFGSVLMDEFEVGPATIEDFVNHYKSYFDRAATLEVVEGESVRHWYH